MEEIADLFPVEDSKILLPILEARLPQSCFIHNQIIFNDKFKDDIKFYTLSTKEADLNTWIVSDYVREDYGHNIAISAPPSITSGDAEIPPEIRAFFTSPLLLKWFDGLAFAALEKKVSQMIYDIAANIKGVVTEVHPCYLYYMDRDKALNLPISHGPEATLKRLDPKTDVEFIMSTWKFSKEESRIVLPKCIANIASAGVYVEGKCVSGVITPGIGMLSALFTLKEHRKKGYGQLTLKYAYKETAKDGCVPCSTAEVTNKGAIGLHESIGCELACIVDWIWLWKTGAD